MKKFSLNDYLVEPEEKVAKRVIYNDDNVLAFVLNIAPGESLPNHTHFECTVLLQAMSGTAQVNVDGKPVAMQENDLIEIDGSEKMSVDNTGNKTLVLYVNISPLPPAERYSVDADL